MFSFLRKKTASRIVWMSYILSLDASMALSKNDQKFKQWIIEYDPEREYWNLFTPFALSFLSLQKRGSNIKDKIFLNVIEKLSEENETSAHFMNDLAKFVTDHKKFNVNFVDATGLWLIWNIKKILPLKMKWILE